MAPGSETISIGVAIHGPDIRAVVVAVGDAAASVKRYASVAHTGADLPRSVARVIDALDSKKELPVGITCGRMADEEQRRIVAAVGPARMVKLHRQAEAIAQLNLAPGTKLDTVEQLAACTVPPRLFEVHPELRFPDLLSAIGAALAIAEQASATTKPVAQPAGRPETPPETPSAATAPAPPVPRSEVSRRAATHIKLPKSEQTVLRRRSRPEPVPDVSTAVAPPAPPAGTDPGTRLAPPPAPPAGTDPGTLKPTRIGTGSFTLVDSDATQLGWDHKREEPFAVPMVRLDPDESADYASARGRKRRWLTGRRPLPIAAAALVVLVGLGVVLGVLLGGSDPATTEAAMRLSVSV